MRKSLFILKATYILTSLVFISHPAFSQGSWDIDYIKIYDLDESYIGQQIRPDFRSNESDTLSGEIIIRKLLSEKSILSVEVDGKKVEFQEKWIIYPDHGNLYDQYLESTNQNEVGEIKIQDIFLESISKNEVSVQANFFYLDTGKSILNRLTFDKKMLKGVLIGI